MSSIRVSFNSHEDLLFLGFNQDFSCFTCGTTSGYKICSTEPMRELGTGQLDDVGDESEFTSSSSSSSKGLSITAIAMLEKSNILALVGNGSTFSRNKVVIWDHAKNLTLATLTFPSPVLNVLMHYHFLVVVLQFNTYVYLLSNLTFHSVYPTADNAAGLCAISTADSPMVLAVPLADPNPGVPVQIARYAAEIENKVIRTHPTSYNLAQLTLNRTGDKLATASENGVHIFVYDTITMQQLKSFRRGNLSSNIFGIAFHPQDKYLCVCSDTGSAHIFDLQRTVSSSWFNPTSWIDPNGERSFAVIHYPDPSGRMPGQRLCCFGQTGNSVILLCADGTYVKFLFSVDGTVVKDGTCSYFMPQNG